MNYQNKKEWYQCKPWYSTYLELKKNNEACSKYDDKAGCYEIRVDGILVYIGKSKDMLQRLAMYLYYSQFPEQHTCNSYRVLNQARLGAHTIDFQPIYYSSSGLYGKQLEDDIGFKEGELIRQYLPPLNYEIPKEYDYKKYTVNKKAKTITLEEILKGNSNKSYYIKF